MSFDLRLAEQWIPSWRRKLLFVFVLVLLSKSLVFALAVPYESDLPPMLADLEPYEDYKYLYLNEARQLLAGKALYREFYHAYPPLFIYTESLLLSTGLPSWTPGFVIFLIDSLTFVPVALIARRLTSERNALMAATGVALAPLHLFYADVLWLNPPPSTFFMLVSTLFLLQGNTRLSSVGLAVATGFKQTSIVLIPIAFLSVWRTSRREAVVFLGIYTGTFLLLSLPYVFYDPLLYLWALGVPGLPTPAPYGPPSGEWKYDLSEPVNLLTFTGLMGFTQVALASKTWLWLLLVGSFVLLTWRFYRVRDPGEVSLVGYLLFSVLIFNGFFARGIYKYFFLAATPLLAALLKGKRHVIYFFALNALILFAPRVTTPWFFLFLASFIPVLIKQRTSSEAAERGSTEGAPSQPLAHLAESHRN